MKNTIWYKDDVLYEELQINIENVDTSVNSGGTNCFTLNISPRYTSTPRYENCPNLSRDRSHDRSCDLNLSRDRSHDRSCDLNLSRGFNRSLPDTFTNKNLQSRSYPGFEDKRRGKKSVRFRSRSFESHCRNRSRSSNKQVQKTPLALLQELLGMDSSRSTFSDVLYRIEELQDKVTSEQFVTRKKSYEIQRLRQRLDHAGKEIDSLRFENRKHSVKNRAFDIEVYKMGARKRRRQLRSLSLPDTSYLPRKVSSSLLESSVISLKSASWDSVGGKEELDSERRPSYLSEVISEDLDYTTCSDFESTLQDLCMDDPKYLRQKIQILERLLKESTTLHAQSSNINPMSNDTNGETISRAEYERLRAEHDVTLQRNSQLVEERVEISRQMDELNSANSQLRKEIDRFESQLRDTNRNKKTVEKDPLENCVCENCLTHLETIQVLQKELRECLETTSEKYDRVVDHYDNVLRERAADLEDLQAQNTELQEENSNLTKILRNTVGGSQKATPEQIQNFRRVSRVSAISGPASVPRDIDKDQLIAQLTNELNRSNAENTSLDNSLSELTANNRSQIEYLENQIEQHEQEKNDIVAQIQVKLEDREFLRAIFEQKKTQDPLFFKQLISEGRRTSHDMESEEDLEFRLRQKCDEVRVLERELQDADEHRQTLERQLEKEHLENKELSQKSSQFQYAKDSLDQIVKEYCSGGLFPRKPETFLFIDEKLTALVNTLYGNFTMIKSLNEEVKWYETEREKQNEDQTSVKIENLEKMVASQKDQIGEQFKDKIKDKCKIRDLEDDLRNKEEEYEEMAQQIQNLQQDKEKYKERLDETDMRCADLEDEFHQFKREVEDERRSQKGSKLKNLQLHSQVWILKNRVSKCEKQRDEVSKNNELLREELQMARDKLEAVNLQMAEQERTARRVSTILKPGGNLTGKDAIIKDLKDQLTRQKSYNNKLEKKLDDKQEKLRELEDKIKDITVDRDAAKDELQRSFSRMDSEDVDFQDSSSNSGPLSMDLLMQMDPKQRHISVDYTIQEEEVHEQFNEAVRENEDLKLELEEMKSKLKRITAELDRERLYVENFDRNYEMQLLKNSELQQKLDDQNRSKVTSSLPVIQESFEESLYDGTLTKEQVNELLEKLNVLQDELGKEKVYVQHLEDQNEQFRIDLCSVSSVEKLSDEEKEDLIGKYSEMEEKLNQRLKELEEAQKTIDDLLKRIHEYQKSELQYQDDIDNVSEQLEQSLNDVVEHESQVAALTSEKTELEAQVREMKDENCRLVDKNIALQEELITVKEGRDVETTAKLKEKDDLIEDANKSVSKWKNDFEESERNLRAVTSQFEGARQELLQSKSKVECLSNELEKAEETIEEKDKECSEVLLKMEELKVEAQKVQEILDEITTKEQQSALAARQLEDQVKTLITEKEESDLLLKEKEESLTVMMKKMEESDIDTVELRQQLEELEAVEAIVKEKDECIEILNEKVKELSESIEKEKVMNNKNRDLMDEMQREVREARVERKMARSMQVESEASIKNIQKQCDEKVKMERLMNDKNREVMNGMQAEVRKCRADRAKTETALSKATATIKNLEGELEKANFELEELKESKEVANLQSAMNAIQDAMQEMELRDAELMKTLEEKVENNLAIQNELASLQKKLDDSDNRYKATLEEKDSTISALESALSEEMIRGDQLEKKLEPFANRQFQESYCQFETETKDNDCQSTAIVLSDFGNQAASEIVEAAAQTNMTVEVLVQLQEKVEILEEQIEKMTKESGYSCNQLVEIREELIAEQERFKSTVSTYEALVGSKQAQIDVLEKDSVELASLQIELSQQLKSAQEENARVKLEEQTVSSQLANMKQENQKLTTANNALQTELDIQLEARNEIDNVIEDKEKEFLEVADKYNMEKIEKDAAKETITILEEEKQQLENYLLETKKKLEDEVEQSKLYQDEASETINSLNNELRRRLLEQSYAHVLSSDSENDDHISTLPRPLRKSADFKDALEETKLSVRALAKANQKLGHQIDKLLTEKDNFIIKSQEESKEIGIMKAKFNEAIIEKDKFETAAKQLEIELMEREVLMENLEESVVYLKRELENQKIQRLKKSPLTQGTLTDLHNLKHKCFMVIPSDPAREILHMFVSQYKENLCSNCYARITTLGSRPCTPRKSPVATPRKSAGSTSDIVVQTDSSLFTYGTDSAYSSSVSIQTEQPSNQSVERLKMKNQQLSNDLSDRKKSEKELELALQYQLKIAGDLQKKVGRLEKREKGLIEQMAGYKERENDAEKKEIQYKQLLERYKAVKEQLIASAENAEKLESELKKRQNCSLPRSSTPDDSNTPPHSECSQLYLSPITNRTSDTKLLCDRQCDTMSPLIITWADSETQTGKEEGVEEEEEALEFQLLRDIQLCTQQLCQTLKLEDDTLPTLTSAVINKLQQLREEKEVLEQETQKEMNRLQEELIAAKDQISKSEDSALDIEEELKRVLDFQEKERVQMQNKVKNFANQLQTELKKARDDKKFAEDALNKSIEKIHEESSLLNDQHEQSLVSMKEERDGLERKLEDMMSKAKEDREQLMKDRNDLERQFFDYKIKSVSEKENLIESQTNNLALLEKLKSDYQQKEDQVNSIQSQCNETIENLRSQIRDLELRDKEKTFEIERLKNKIHQYTNREVDATEKLTQSQKIIDALKRDVLETRARLENLAGYEVKCGDTETENAALRSQVQNLENTKLTLLEEARELKEAIEHARDTLNSRVELESYKNPALAAVAALWMQEREEVNDTKDALQATEWELQELKSEARKLDVNRAEVEQLKKQITLVEEERAMMKTKLSDFQERQIEAENTAESAKEELNSSLNQLQVLLSDKEELQSLLARHTQEKDRLLEDLNQSFKQKNEKEVRLENCLAELSSTQDQLFAVKEELVRNRAEAEKLRESLQRARTELDDLDKNIGQIKEERDALAASQPKMYSLEKKIGDLELLNKSLSRRLAVASEERQRAEEEATGVTDKLERDVAEILEAFEEYKERTGTAPEKVQELKHGMAALQETLHQIMNTNSELSKEKIRLNQELDKLKLENSSLSHERNEYKHQLDNSLIDLSKDGEVSNELIAHNQMLQAQLDSLSQRSSRLDKLEHDNTILKNKVRKMREMLREKEDQLINLNESYEMKEELEKENAHFKKIVTSLKQKLDKSKEANVMLKDKVRDLEESRDQFMASTPNHSRGNRSIMDVSDELEPIRSDTDPRRLAVESRTSMPSLASQSRVSMATSQMSSLETISLAERCKTLDIELKDLKERYKILQDTHESEQNKAHEMSDALRNSVRILKNYIDRSGDVKGERMSELQDQLEIQRSQLFSMADQLGVDLAQSSIHLPDRESLASVSTVCMEGADNQLI